MTYNLYFNRKRRSVKLIRHKNVPNVWDKIILKHFMWKWEIYSYLIYVDVRSMQRSSLYKLWQTKAYDEQIVNSLLGCITYRIICVQLPNNVLNTNFNLEAYHVMIL